MQSKLSKRYVTTMLDEGVQEICDKRILIPSEASEDECRSNGQQIVARHLGKNW